MTHMIWVIWYDAYNMPKRAISQALKITSSIPLKNLNYLSFDRSLKLLRYDSVQN